MRLVIQRVSEAHVNIAGSTVGQIQKGYMILFGVSTEDETQAQEHLIKHKEELDASSLQSMPSIEWLVKKVMGLRIFDDDNGVMNRSIMDVQGNILVVSQFTLHALVKKGNRPSYIRAAGHEYAIPMYEGFCLALSQALGKPVQTGQFGAAMEVGLVNDGPVTILIDSNNRE